MKTLLLVCALVSLAVAGSLSNRQHKYVPYPKHVLGLYILLADDTEEGRENNATKWTPGLYEWQQQSANLLFFCFIKPDDMDVPMAYQKLAQSRGTGKNGSVPADTVILFAIGGYVYSSRPDLKVWPWLTSQSAAEEMAAKVAEWPNMYGCDGIDLDIETGAGDTEESGVNMVHFLKKLKELNPSMIVNQPVFGYPQVTAENYVVNHSWDKDATYLGLANSIGIMAYEGSQSLNYVKNYADATSQWDGFPITVNVPRSGIQLGCMGGASASVINTLASEAVKQELQGIMVWYASVVNGFTYSQRYDASQHEESQKGYIAARQILDP